MYTTVSNSFITEINKNGRTFIAGLKLNGSNVPCTIKTIKYQGSSNGESYITLGSAVCATAELVLHKPSFTLGVSEYEVLIGMIINNSPEYVSLGFFTPDKPKYDGEDVTVTMYDRMRKFEKSYFSSLTYPASITSVVNEICTQCEVPYVSFTSNLAIETLPEGYSCREMITYIGQMLGKFAIINKEGKLQFKWYSSTNYTLPTSRYWNPFTRSESNYTIHRLCAIIGKEKNAANQEVDIQVVAGTGAKGIVFANPFYTQAICTSVFNSISNLTYRPASVEAMGDLRLEVGDIITIADNSNNSYSVPVMSLGFEYSGGLSMSISAVGEDDQKSDFSVKGPTTQAIERMYTRLMLMDSMYANKAVVDVLEANYAKISSLLAGNAAATQADLIQLNALNAVIDSGLFHSLLAEDASIGDLIAGTIYTNLFRIKSDDGSFDLNGKLMQFRDSNNIIRIQIGQDAQGNYNYYLCDENGDLLWDATGITANAVPNELIVDDMVANTSSDYNGISANKLNIHSLVGAVNREGGLKSSSIVMDENGQTLYVAFGRMQNDVGNLSTKMTVANGKISQIISNVELGGLNGKTMYSELVNVEQTANKLVTQYSQLATDFNGMSSQLAIYKQGIDEYLVQLSEQIGNIKVGATNLMLGTKEPDVTDDSTLPHLKGQTVNTTTSAGTRTTALHGFRITNTSAVCTEINFGGYEETGFRLGTDVLDGSAVLEAYNGLHGLGNGKSYTLSFDAEWKLLSSDNSTTKQYIRAEYADSVESAICNFGEIQQGNKGQVMTGHCVLTFTVPETSTGGNLRILCTDDNPLHYASGDYIEISNLMFEESNVPSDWSPAPEDVDGLIQEKYAELSLTLDEFRVALGNRIGEAELKITPQAICSTVKEYGDFHSVNILSLDDLTASSSTKTVDGYSIYVETSSSNGGIVIPKELMAQNNPYTLSFTMAKKEGTLANIGFETSNGYTVKKFAVDGTEYNNQTSVSLDDNTTNHKVVLSVTRNADQDLIIQPNKGVSTSVKVEMWRWQLEYGDSATAWSPVIEDTTSLTESMITQTANEIYAYADTIRLQADILVWDATNSSMDRDGKLTIASAEIGNVSGSQIHIGNGNIYSGSHSAYNSTNQGYWFGSDGSFGVGDSSAYITWSGGSNPALAIRVSSLEWTATYSSMTSSGALTITSATIGDTSNSAIHIGNGSIYSGSHSTYNSLSPGFYLDGSGNFGVGSNSAYILWDGSGLSIKGAITATSLTLSSNASVSGFASVAMSGDYSDLSSTPDLTVYISKGGTIGTTPAEGVTGFVVSNQGLLQCSNAVVYGTLYSSAGTIGGVTLGRGCMYTGSHTSHSSSSPGFYVDSNGYFGVGNDNAYMRWSGNSLDIKVSSLVWSATNSSMSSSGELTIKSAKIGTTSGSQIYIGNGSIYSGSHSTYNSSNAGFYFDGNGYFGIGNDTRYLRWNGSSLDIAVSSFAWTSTYSSMTSQGQFECTYGNIGGVKIVSNGIYAENGNLVTSIDASIGKIHVYRRISTSGSDFLLPSVNYSYFCASTNGVEATAVSTSSFSVGALPSDLSGDSAIGSIYFDVDSGGLGCYVDAYFNRVCIGNKSTSYGFYCTLSSYFSGEAVFNDNVRVLGGRAIRFGSTSANGFISDSGSIKLSLGSAVNSGSTIVSDSNGRMKTLSSSSKRYKNYLGELPDEDAERLLNLPVIEFVYKPGYLDREDAGNGKKFAGLFAEDVAGQFDDAAFKKDGLVENYSDRQLLVRLIKLCQIQQKEIDELKSQIAVSA